MRFAPLYARMTLAAITVFGATWKCSAHGVEAPSESTPLTVMTFNIRWPLGQDVGSRSWRSRRPAVIEVIHRQQPDIIGLQEAHPNPLADITTALNQYEAIPPSPRRSANAILFRKERFKVVQSGEFDFTDPDNPHTDPYANWARLADKESAIELMVFNVHLEQRSESARVSSAAALAEHIEKHTAGAPVLVTGDFNAEASSPVVQVLLGPTGDDGKSNGASNAPVKLVDAFKAVDPGETRLGTSHAFTGATDGPRIDFVLASIRFRVEDARIISEKVGDLYPSDHFPVVVRLRLLKDQTVRE